MLSARLKEGDDVLETHFFFMLIREFEGLRLRLLKFPFLSLSCNFHILRTQGLHCF